MRTDEGKVKDEIKKIFRKFDLYYFMPVQMGYGATGVPDFLVCANGYFIGVEAKATHKDEPTGLQVKNLKEIQDAGGQSLVIHKDNLHVLENLLDQLYARADNA